jgi:serine/threonine-protein kinase
MGNTAVVYAGIRLHDGFPVAVKFYNPRLTDEFGKNQELEIERFRREFVAANHIDHPNVLSVLDFGEPFTEDGTPLSPFIVMERLEEDLRTRLTQSRVSIETSVLWLRDIANGLCAIHEKGIVHRDMKPANVMFRSDVPVIVDFGFSKNCTEDWITAPGDFLGSLDYASPEQLQSSAHITSKTDVFSLGLMGIEMVTGVHPCPWNPTDIRYRTNRSRQPAVDETFEAKLPDQLRAILLSCVAMSADARPASSQVSEELSRVIKEMQM